MSLITSLIPSVFKAVSGSKQVRDSKRMNPTDPGYLMNKAVIDNARILGERATNYEMPGYGQALDNIKSGTATAMAGGVQGASSGGDVLDLASKLAYGQGQQLNKLATQTAEATENAQMQALKANEAAGAEYQGKNAFDRERYQQKLAEKAALLQAGNTNIYGAINDGAKAIGETEAKLTKVLTGGLG